jgi:hypothetical protein
MSEGKIRHGDGDVSEILSRGVCPFCKLEYGMVKNESQGTGVFHSQPSCEQFIALDPLDFLIKARQAKGIFLPGEKNVL